MSMFSSLLDGLDNRTRLDFSALTSPPAAHSSAVKSIPRKPAEMEIFSPPAITPALSPFTSPVLPVPLSPFLLSPPSLTQSAVSPHQDAYLRRLQRNPMFKDLQSLLAQECLHMQVPTNLIDSSIRTADHSELFPRHMRLQERFLELRAIESLRSQGLTLESTYSGEVGQIEVARYQALCAAGISSQHRQVVNHHHDKKRLALIQQYEQMILRVLNTNDLKKNILPKPSQREMNKPLLTSDKGVISMAFPHKSSIHVARQLAFSMDSHECTRRPDTPDSIPEVASSPECLEVDLSPENCSDEEPNTSVCKMRTALGDSGICEDDASSCVSDGSDSDSYSGCHRKQPTSCEKIHSVSTNSVNTNSVLQPMDTNRHTDIFNSGNKFKRNADFLTQGHGTEETKHSVCGDLVDNSDTTCRPSVKRKRDSETSDENSHIQQSWTCASSRSKKITSEATFILSTWYSEHIRYPYPSDLEVMQLAEQTGLSHQQIKKWMANKRVRSYNTLSITGNQHPIKFKFKGHRYTDTGQEMKSNNYKQLHPEARRILNTWYDANRDNPYPSDEEKSELARLTGITDQQLKSWFANKRSRANNTKKQVPNYFIKKFPEYTRHVQMVSLTRELARKTRKNDGVDSVLQCAFRN